ncbi:hypothetical protein KRIGEM_02967 (plasmid) [Komagataeibacter rhaeticus]|nr:hypothetical protein KRIGEM_02967 [Komagataeibacter rhaeticus]
MATGILPSLAREMFAQMAEEYGALMEHIRELDEKLATWHRSQEVSRRLSGIPGIGPLWLDNVFIERLWRSLKYECVYLHAFETGSELRAGLGRWIAHYNERRPHTALAGRTPDEAYHDVPTPSGPGLTPDQRANSNAARRAA